MKLRNLLKSIFVIMLLFIITGCNEPSVVDIKLSEDNIKQDIDDFNITDLNFTVTYDDNTVNIVNVTNEMLSKEDLDKLKELGKHDIKINYLDKVITLNINLINYYEVTFILDDKVVDTQTVEHGMDAILPNESTTNKEGYTFIGWNHDGKNITEDTIIIGTNEINTYVVKFVLDDVVIDTQIVEHGKDTSLPDESITNKKGYVFLGWDSDGKNITNDTIITGTYELKLINFDNEEINDLISEKAGFYIIEHPNINYNIINKIKLSKEKKLYLFNFNCENFYYLAYYRVKTELDNNIGIEYKGYKYETKETIKISIEKMELTHIFLVQEGIISENLLTNEKINQKSTYIEKVEYEKVGDSISFQDDTEKIETFVFWAFDVNEYKNKYNIDYSIIEYINKAYSPCEKYEINEINKEKYVQFRIAHSENKEIIEGVMDKKFGGYKDDVLNFSDLIIENESAYLSANLKLFINWLNEGE